MPRPSIRRTMSRLWRRWSAAPCPRSAVCSMSAPAAANSARRSHDPALPWTAIEPSPTMRARLGALGQPPRMIAAGWETADVPAGGHDTVLAATMPAFFDQPEALPRALPRLGAAQRRLGRAGACRTARSLLRRLPAARMARRGRDARHRHRDAWPGAVVAAARTSPSPTGPSPASCPDLAELSAYLADRLGWAARDLRRAELSAHLVAPGEARRRRRCASTLPGRSAVLVWGNQ